MVGKRYLAREEGDAAAEGVLVDADEEDGADLEGEELDAVDVAAEGAVVDALDALGVQHGVLAGRQPHVLDCRTTRQQHHSIRN